MIDFRFEELEIWKESIRISDALYLIADDIDSKGYRRFSEQLRGAAMSISNNIAEGSGSYSKKEFAQFLNISRRSIFECANILVILERRGLIPPAKKDELFNELATLSRRMNKFRNSL